MANKTVLLSYLDRNKKVIIIKESESVQSESDFQYLRRKVLELFNFKTEGNVKLDIIFQEFDEEFGEFIDIEQQEECDDLIKDKQKLKVVVTPSLTTPTQSVSVTETLSVTGTPASSAGIDDRDGWDSSDSDVIPVRMKRPTIDSDSASVKQRKYVLKTLPWLMSKAEDDAAPLPDPFVLPKHFRPDVDSALKLGKMTVSTNKAFLSTVAGSMFSHKRYPDADDYTNVARTIVQKYPFMKSPTGKPYGAIVMGLKNRFKERRRVKKPRTSSPMVPMRKQTKKPSVKIHELPDVPDGEDATSFERHNRMLTIEFSKPTPNNCNVEQIMKITYPMRRRDIIEFGHMKDYNALVKYPFLQDSFHILEEFQRIAGDTVDSFRSVWARYAPKIVNQARMERGARLSALVKQMLDGEEDKGNSIIAVCLLIFLLPDSRSKPSLEKVIVFTEVSSDINSLASSNQAEPHAIIIGDHKSQEQAFLIVDKKVVCEIPINDIPIFLLAIFYILNIEYPSGCANVYSFLEVALLSVSEPQVVINPSVNNLLARLAD